MVKVDYVIIVIILAVILFLAIVEIGLTIGAIFDQAVGLDNWYVWLVLIFSLILTIISGGGVWYYSAEKLQKKN